MHWCNLFEKIYRWWDLLYSSTFSVTPLTYERFCNMSCYHQLVHWVMSLIVIRKVGIHSRKGTQLKLTLQIHIWLNRNSSCKTTLSLLSPNIQTFRIAFCEQHDSKETVCTVGLAVEVGVATRLQGFPGPIEVSRFRVLVEVDAEKRRVKIKVKLDEILKCFRCFEGWSFLVLALKNEPSSTAIIWVTRQLQNDL